MKSMLSSYSNKNINTTQKNIVLLISKTKVKNVNICIYILVTLYSSFSFLNNLCSFLKVYFVYFYGLARSTHNKMMSICLHSYTACIQYLTCFWSELLLIRDNRLKLLIISLWPFTIKSFSFVKCITLRWWRKLKQKFKHIINGTLK